jgi:hypothetical protein
MVVLVIKKKPWYDSRKEVVMALSIRPSDLKHFLVADECWTALASLHRDNPGRTGFTAREIIEWVSRSSLYGSVRAGVQPHIYQHNVANVAPSSARYRLFYRNPDGTLRLFRPNDDFHPSRTGKTAPDPNDLPEEYHHLLDWYRNDYCSPPTGSEQEDPVLAMLGVGEHLWKEERGDEFIARERRGWDHGETRHPSVTPDPATSLWGVLLSRVKPGQAIQNWSVAHGDLPASFTVESLHRDRIEISSSGIKRGPRTVYKSDFENLARSWREYKKGTVPRHLLRDASKNSTYIISLLHLIDAA